MNTKVLKRYKGADLSSTDVLKEVLQKSISQQKLQVTHFAVDCLLTCSKKGPLLIRNE